jgi:hypothetical protein
MICEQLSSIIGLACTPMDDIGSVALIDTPFRFADGDALPVLVQSHGAQVRFFDDGGVAWHLMGRGIDVSDARKTRFLHTIAEAHGVKLNENLELEAWADAKSAPDVFAKFLLALLAAVLWEREHEGVDVDAAQLLDEVAVLLSRAHPSVDVQREIPLAGISRQSYKMDFVVGNEVVLAIRPNHGAVSSAIRKILDVKNHPENAAYSYKVVIDDRVDHEAALREGAVVGTVAVVRLFGSLQKSIPSTTSLH